MPKGHARPGGRRATSFTPEEERELLASFEAGTPAAELARHFGKSNGHVYSVIRRAGLRPSMHWRPGIHRDMELEKKVVEIYEQGPLGGAKRIARATGISYATVREILKRHNIETRSQRIPQATIDRIAALQQGGASQMAISRETGISQPQVSRVFKKLGIPGSSYRGRGENHPAWKGGRFVAHGYVRVYLDDTHPFFQAMASLTGYTMEHRLVMAEMLGRPLLPSESVHHIDGNKLHNDRSNLQLRQAYHGKGIVLQCRACGSRNVEAIELDAAPGPTPP